MLSGVGPVLVPPSFCTSMQSPGGKSGRSGSGRGGRGSPGGRAAVGSVADGRGSQDRKPQKVQARLTTKSYRKNVRNWD